MDHGQALILVIEVGVIAVIQLIAFLMGVPWGRRAP